MTIPNNPEVEAKLTHGAALMDKQITETETWSLENEKYWMEKIQAYGIDAYRIYANRDIPMHGVKKGDKGGIIHHPRNLSYIGESWITKGADVDRFARVQGNALVGYGSYVSDHAIVQGNAQVSNAVIEGSAKVSDDSVIAGRPDARIEIRDRVQVFGKSRVEGWSTLRHSVLVEDATVLQAHITGNAILRQGAFVRTNEQWIAFGGVGSENGTLTAYPLEDGTIACNRGCFEGTLEAFELKMLSRHPEGSPYRSEYDLLIRVIKSKFNPEREALAIRARNATIYRP